MRASRKVRSTAAVLFTCIAIILGSAMGAMGQGNSGNAGPPDDRAPPGGNHTANETDNRSDRARGPPLTHGPPEGPQRLGRANLADGLLNGTYVQFTFDNASGQIFDYSVGGMVWFDEIQAPGSFDARAAGAHVRLRGDGFTAHAIDNPTGLFRAHVGSDDFILQPAEGVDAEANGSHVILSAENASAVVTNASIDGDSIRVGHGAFMLKGPSVSLVARSAHPSQAAVDEAIADGRVAGRFQVIHENATDVLAFDNLTMQAQRLPNGTHRFLVDANFTEGRVFIAEFAPGLLAAGQVGVRYYDEVLGVLVEAPISQADSLEDVLAVEAGEGAEYWAVHGLEGLQVLVAIPNFSVHAFEILSIPPEVAPLLVYGVVLGAGVAVLMAVGAVFGRRRPA